MMDISDIFNYLTFRNIILAIFCLPLAAMLITMPFLSLLSKSAKEWLEILGFFGAIGNCVVVIELAFRTIAEIIYYSTQKPQYFSDTENGNFTLVKHYDHFDTFPVKYFFVFLLITVSTWIVMDINSTKKKFGRAGKKYSGKNPLNLSE
jgi:hypothetical protein